ncbi:hypothetical protein MIT9_P0015 [Methylomarinovum caldicuralii]|uniref:DUF1538 domain-containing protein n=1 Tax=Methylomarinovum caldicuralii TaxID=438856 RepID=A0AAU9CLX2_9GAMM|nr:DUF1538 domain-containing protein [Methylomarinovum caldicuralii]BCX80442.1 hypothetical protein MIT9_P0015 [Methylomarinovum caldicuralii]
MAWLKDLLGAMTDLMPIAVTIGVFQLGVIRRPLPQWRRLLGGLALVVVGMALFLRGLESALFPLGELMARQLTGPGFIDPAQGTLAYGWVYAFAFCLGFTTTLAEPALIAVALKAQEISGGAIHAWGLRLAVSLGVAIGLVLGAYRIVSGASLFAFIVGGYAVVVVQTAFAPRSIVGLAYDSGGVTTSTVTVPLVTALGLGLARAVPGRDVLVDGFGLIAFASLFPIMTVLGYAQLAEWSARRGH